MYRLSYKNPVDGHWTVVSVRENLDDIKEIWDSIFWSAASNWPIEFGGMEDFLRIDDLSKDHR